MCLRMCGVKVSTQRLSKARTKVQRITVNRMQVKDDKQQQFEDLLQDFYVWKVWRNDLNWKQRFFEDKEKALLEVKRPSLYK